MAWTHVASATASTTLAAPSNYPPNNNPDFAGGGIILSIPVEPSIADGDVVVLAVRRSVLMPRGTGNPLSAPAGWDGVDMVTKFPCIPLSSAQQDITDYGAEYLNQATGLVLTCGIISWTFQITDPTAHLTLGDWLINVDWDPGSGAEEWGESTSDLAYIIGGASVFRSDTNPTWQCQEHTGFRGCSYVSYPHTGMTSGDKVYCQISAADSSSAYAPPVADDGGAGWTSGWTKDATIDSNYGIGLQYALGSRPNNEADWLMQDNIGGTYTGVGGGDGSGNTAGSMYRSWAEYSPADPPVVIDEQASSCLLHIPHHRWLEGVEGDKQTKKDLKPSKSKSDGPFRLVEENWHEVESWIAHFLTDDSCRPCSEYVTPPVE